jgi:toxin ParE1/3/4
MPFAVEFSADSERDLALIFDHLFDSYVGFGESTDEALEHAARRVLAVRRAADRLANAPVRGTRRDDVLPGLRHVAFGRAVYRFDVDETVRKVRILAIFFGGQDHVRRMLIRLLGDDETSG